MSAHIHACHVCGEQWTHDEALLGPSHEAWEAAHTCPKGHKVTVKYDADIAAGVVQACKEGRDPLPWLREHDPMAAFTLELESDPLGDLFWDGGRAPWLLAGLSSDDQNRMAGLYSRARQIMATKKWVAA